MSLQIKLDYRDGYVYGQHDVLTWLAGNAPEDSTLAAFDMHVQMRASLVCLAHNLAVGGGLSAAFKAGDNFGFHMGSDESQCTCQWEPGRGEPYRGFTRCEQDDFDDHEPYRMQRCSQCGDELDLCSCPWNEPESEDHP